jgi:hypothetical protein
VERLNALYKRAASDAKEWRGPAQAAKTRQEVAAVAAQSSAEGLGVAIKVAGVTPQRRTVQYPLEEPE